MFLRLRFQHSTARGINSKAVTLPGIQFPIADDALDKLEEVRDKEISYVQLVRFSFI